MLILSLGFFGFAIWLAGVDLDRQSRLYDIHFTGSVAGLGVGGDVRYRGIRIGSVTEIGIDPEDPALVLTRVEIDSTAPIRVGDVASLQLQGITGIAFVNIDGARAGSGPLEAAEGRPWPLIPSKQSNIERLFASAPELLTRAIEVTDNLAKLLGPDNQRSIAGILADVKVLTGVLAGQEQRVDGVLNSLEASAADIAGAMSAARGLIERLDPVVDDATETLAVARGAFAGIDGTVNRDVAIVLNDLKSASADIAAITASFARIAENNEDDLSSFAADGLGEFRRFVTESRLLVASLSRLTERLEAGGAQSLFGLQGAEEERR